MKLFSRSRTRERSRHPLPEERTATEERELHELKVGSTTIPYSVRFSRRARRRRIVVRPEKVEIVAPFGDSEKALHRIMFLRREWIGEKLRSLRERTDRLTGLTSYTLRDGTRIPYRGRLLVLRIHPSVDGEVRIEYRTGFHIHRPHGITDEALRKSMDHWLKKRLEADIEPLLKKYSTILQVKPGRITIRDMKTRWGSCGRSGNISINLRLIHLSGNSLEYVVAHELCHLKCRDHSRKFWNILDSVLPEHIPRMKRIEGFMP